MTAERKQYLLLSKRELVHGVLSNAVGKLLLAGNVEYTRIPTSERQKIEKRIDQLSYAVASQLRHLPKAEPITTSPTD